MSEKKTYIDLFAGCGGLSLGLHNSDLWKGKFAIEKSPDAFKTLKYNLIEKRSHFEWPNWLTPEAHDINEIIKNYPKELKLLRGQIDMIAGGPPCQGFSMAGQRNENDNRNKLIDSYVKFVNLVKPKFIFFENVKGFTMEFRNNKNKGKKYSEIVTKKLTNSGYNVYGELVNFGEFGVPQKRTRFILIGIRKDIENSSVKKAKSFFNLIRKNRFDFLKDKKIPFNPTVKDAISDLLSSNPMVETPDRQNYSTSIYGKRQSKYQSYVRKGVTGKIPDSHSFAKHSENVVNRLKYIQKVSTECKNLSKKLKDELGLKKQVLIPLQAGNQCPTITSHPDDLIHYSEPRILTVREYARIQSFPDWYKFRGKYTTGGKLRKIEVPRYTQIGNAIPPLFGELAGQTIVNDLML
jgi:DNA (cytosine-5)-methyltransferase 1